MSVIALDNKIGFFITSTPAHGAGAGLSWILATGFWDDQNIWLDGQVWNDGV